LDADYAVRKLEDLRNKVKAWEARHMTTASVEFRAWKAEVEDWFRTSGGQKLGTELDRKRDEVTRGGTNLYGDAGA
jgi:hypothetical protein